MASRSMTKAGHCEASFIRVEDWKQHQRLDCAKKWRHAYLDSRLHSLSGCLHTWLPSASCRFTIFDDSFLLWLVCFLLFLRLDEDCNPGWGDCGPLRLCGVFFAEDGELVLDFFFICDWTIRADSASRTMAARISAALMSKWKPPSLR